MYIYIYISFTHTHTHMHLNIQEPSVCPSVIFFLLIIFFFLVSKLLGMGCGLQPVGDQVCVHQWRWLCYHRISMMTYAYVWVCVHTCIYVAFIRDDGSVIIGSQCRCMSMCVFVYTRAYILLCHYVRVCVHTCIHIVARADDGSLMGWLWLVGSLNYRSLLQNIVSFVGLFCIRDLYFWGAYYS